MIETTVTNTDMAVIGFEIEGKDNYGDIGSLWKITHISPKYRNSLLDSTYTFKKM